MYSNAQNIHFTQLNMLHDKMLAVASGLRSFVAVGYGELEAQGEHHITSLCT